MVQNWCVYVLRSRLGVHPLGPWFGLEIHDRRRGNIGRSASLFWACPCVLASWAISCGCAMLRCKEGCREVRRAKQLPRFPTPQTHLQGAAFSLSDLRPCRPVPRTIDRSQNKMRPPFQGPLSRYVFQKQKPGMQPQPEALGVQGPK